MTLRNVSKSHLQTGKHICMWDGFSPQANWRLAGRLLYHQGCKRETCMISVEGERSDRLGTSDPERGIRGRWGPSRGSEQQVTDRSPQPWGPARGRRVPCAGCGAAGTDGGFHVGSRGSTCGVFAPEAEQRGDLSRMAG